MGCTGLKNTGKGHQVKGYLPNRQKPKKLGPPSTVHEPPASNGLTQQRLAAGNIGTALGHDALNFGCAVNSTLQSDCVSARQIHNTCSRCTDEPTNTCSRHEGQRDGSQILIRTTTCEAARPPILKQALCPYNFAQHVFNSTSEGM